MADPVVPDLAGFDRAMRRLREPPFSTPVTFHLPGVRTYPAGTSLDPESGKPFDPYVPFTSTAHDVTVNCSLVTRPLARLLQAERLNQPLGWVKADTTALIINPEDGASLASGTSAQPGHCTVLDERYAIQDFRLDETAGSKSVVVYLKSG